jgi:hypothetical protein
MYIFFVALVAEEFLENSASQLTYHGLCELCTQLKEDELAVLFRNNHFTTLYRHKVIGQAFYHILKTPTNFTILYICKVI